MTATETTRAFDAMATILSRGGFSPAEAKVVGLFADVGWLLGAGLAEEVAGTFFLTAAGCRLFSELNHGAPASTPKVVRAALHALAPKRVAADRKVSEPEPKVTCPDCCGDKFQWDAAGVRIQGGCIKVRCRMCSGRGEMSARHYRKLGGD